MEPQTKPTPREVEELLHKIEVQTLERELLAAQTSDKKVGSAATAVTVVAWIIGIIILGPIILGTCGTCALVGLGMSQ